MPYLIAVAEDVVHEMNVVEGRVRAEAGISPLLKGGEEMRVVRRMELGCTVPPAERGAETGRVPAIPSRPAQAGPSNED